MPSLNLRKRLSDFRYLNQRIESSLKSNNNWTTTNDVQEVDNMFDLVESLLVISDRTTSNRQRRTGQINWRTTVKILRQQNG